MPEWKKNLVKDRIKNSIILKKVQKVGTLLTFLESLCGTLGFRPS